MDDGIDLLTSERSLTTFGEFLHETWMAKRSWSPLVSNPRLDEFYEAARDAGAIGGKLLGAGAGGFVLLCVPPTCQERVGRRLSNHLHVPFRFTHTGSSVIFDSRKDRSPAARETPTQST